jgi:hypothetical protein
VQGAIAGSVDRKADADQKRFGDPTYPGSFSVFLGPKWVGRAGKTEGGVGKTICNAEQGETLTKLGFLIGFHHPFFLQSPIENHFSMPVTIGSTILPFFSVRHHVNFSIIFFSWLLDTPVLDWVQLTQHRRFFGSQSPNSRVCFCVVKHHLLVDT